MPSGGSGDVPHDFHVGGKGVLVGNKVRGGLAVKHGGERKQRAGRTGRTVRRAVSDGVAILA